MAEASFAVKGRNVLRVRLEPTEICGAGNSAFPLLTMRMKLQLHPIEQQQQQQRVVSHYTLLRFAGKLFLPNEFSDIARFETPPLAETSSTGSYERTLSVDVPLNIGQIKRIEELRDGKNLDLRISVMGLAVLDPNGEFCLLQEVLLQVSVPKSHWIEEVLNKWKVSDLRLLEINSSANGKKEIVQAQFKLAQAEQFYRAGAYPQALTELRHAFIALLEECSGKSVDKNTLESLLCNTHPKVREALVKAFTSYRDILHLGPHEPSPTPEVPIPISRHDARFALVTAHAIFEYFSSENWPGI